MGKIITRGSLMVILIIGAFLVFRLLNRIPDRRDITDYNADEYDSVKITYSTDNSRYEITTSDTNLISSFFSTSKNCLKISEEKTRNIGLYDLTFYGEIKAIFSIRLLSENRVTLNDLTPNISLIGSGYKCDSLDSFITKLKKLKMKRIY